MFRSTTARPAASSARPDWRPVPYDPRPAAPRAEGDRRRAGTASLLSTVTRVLCAAFFAASAALLLVNQDADAETMLASYYGHGDGFHGQTMANGQTFDMNDPTTVASPTLPFGTRLDCTYKGNSARVEVKDRGPYTSDGRQLDFSYAAALKLGLTEVGADYVDCTTAAPGASASASPAASASASASASAPASGADPVAAPAEEAGSASEDALSLAVEEVGHDRDGEEDSEGAANEEGEGGDGERSAPGDPSEADKSEPEGGREKDSPDEPDCDRAAPGDGACVILAGDTLLEVAGRVESSVDELLLHNENVTDPDLIFAGDDTLRLEGQSAEVGPDGGETYVVKSGDTLSEISQEKGTPVEHLVASNPEISDPDLIYPGQTLRL